VALVALAPKGNLAINPVCNAVAEDSVAPVVRLSGLNPGFTPTMPESKDPAAIQAAVALQLPAGSVFTVEVSEHRNETTIGHEAVVEVTCSEDVIIIGDPRDLEADLNGEVLVEQGAVTVTDNEVTLETEHLTRTVTIDISSLGSARTPAEGGSEPANLPTSPPPSTAPRCTSACFARSASDRPARAARWRSPRPAAATAKGGAGHECRIGQAEAWKWKILVLKVKPKDRKLVAKMAQSNKKPLIVRQALHAERFRHGRHQAVFHKYKVRSG
jgi:hypothetical protein